MTVSRTIRARAFRIAPASAKRPLELGPARHHSHLTLLDPFEAERLQRACDRFLASTSGGRHRSYAPRANVLSAVKTLRGAGTAKAFGLALDDVFDAITVSGHRPQHALELAARLWEEGCVLLPLGALVTGTACVFGEIGKGRGYKYLPTLSGKAGELVERARSYGGEAGIWPEPRHVAAAMFWALVTTQGLVAGAPMAWAEARALYGVNRECASKWHLMHALDALAPAGAEPECGDAAPAQVHNVRGRGAGTRSDPEFRWSTAQDATMEAWRATCARWIQGIEGTQAKNHVTTANTVLRLLSELPRECREQATLLDPRHPHHGTVARRIRDTHAGSYLTATLVRARSLFARALFDLSRAPDGSHAARAELANPVPWSEIPPPPPQRKKTEKRAIPVEWVEEFTRIITEDNFAWPRTLASDVFEAADGSGLAWSPVRAYLMLALLAYQGRFATFEMADSGEGDPWLPVFRGDEEEGTVEWIENDLDTERHAEPRGILREHEGWPHLFLTYNKASPDFASHWQNRRLFRLICDLREWQAAHNPAKRPTPFSDLSRSALATRAGVEVQPPRYHLFRDPANERNPMAPVSIGRMQDFFLACQKALERDPGSACNWDPFASWVRCG